MTVEALAIESIESTTPEKVRSEAGWVYAAVPLLAAAIAFTWTLYGQLQRMYGLTSDTWDLARYQQAVWGITQGSWLFSGLEPILLGPAAIEKVWPSPVVLVIFSSAGLAAAGPAAYFFFRAILPADRKESALLAVALAAPIPFWAATQAAAGEFFHPENLALPFALVAAWAGLRGRQVLLWTLSLLALTCGEAQVYTVAVLAVLMAVHGAPAVKKHWRLILYVAVAWFVVGVGVVRQELRSSSTDLGVALVWPGGLVTAGVIVASMSGLPLLAPRWLLLAIPGMLAALLSPHAALLLMFPLIVAGGVGARRFLERTSFRPVTALVAAVPALILAWGTGGMPPALLAPSDLYSKPNSVAQLQAAASVIPADAPVNADAGLDVWLANRHVINDFPNRLDASSFVVLDSQFYLGSRTNRAQRDAAASALATGGRRLLYDDGRFLVWSPVGD